jgi:hypothetical protein
MSLTSRLAVPLFVLAPLIAAAPARAEITADAAAALQAQIRAWVADLTGPAIDLGSHAVRVTPAGDAYRLEWPVMGPVGTTGWEISGDPVTVIAKPLDGGRWSIESMRLPTPLRAEQQPAQDGEPHNWEMTLAGQNISGRFDPSLATNSTFDMELRGYNSSSQTAKGTQTVHLDRYTGHGGWQPTGDGRVTISDERQGENLTVSMDVPGGPGPITVKATAVHGSVRVERIAFDRLGAALRSIRDMVPAAMQAAGAAGMPDAVTPEDRAALHDLVVALRDLLGGVQQETTLEHIGFDVGGMGGTLASLTIGGRAAASDGMLDASLHLAMEGIDSPMIPKGPLRDYLPRRLALTPHLSGIPANDAVSLLLRAIDAGDAALLQAEALGLLAKGPLKAGLDDVLLDLGVAVMKGNGTMTIAAPDDIKGSARIVATGLDALIRSANTVPEMRSAAPFLIIIKGIGDQKGDTVTWNITYADGQTKVNGTDLSALTSPPAAPRDRPRPRRP